MEESNCTPSQPDSVRMTEYIAVSWIASIR
jgi:hypothetical protein